MPHGQSRSVAGDHARFDRQNMGRSLILPDKFSGEEDFSEWGENFNSVSIVNGWNDDDKYKWLNVHIARKTRVILTKVQQFVKCSQLIQKQ